MPVKIDQKDNDRLGSPNLRTMASGRRSESIPASIAYVDTNTGFVSADSMVKAFRVTKRELASALGLGVDSLTRAERVRSPKVQARLREATQILSRVQPWAGSEGAAWAWYRSTPIPALGDLTPEELVARGRSDDVRAYLTHLADRGYA